MPQGRNRGALWFVGLVSFRPVADELLGHEVPFILVTGYSGHKGDPPVLKRAPRVRKPVNFDELADRMTEVFIRRWPNANEADEPERSPISSSN